MLISSCIAFPSGAQQRLYASCGKRRKDDTTGRHKVNITADQSSANLKNMPHGFRKNGFSSSTFTTLEFANYASHAKVLTCFGENSVNLRKCSSNRIHFIVLIDSGDSRFARGYAKGAVCLDEV